MPSPRVCLFLFGAAVLAGPLAGQDGKKKDDPKKDDPKVKEKEDDKEPAPKYKGTLPANWKKLGLTDEQTKSIYKLQGKYGEKIDKLEEQIKELKSKLTKERYELLTSEQKKRLDELTKAKASGGG